MQVKITSHGCNESTIWWLCTELNEGHLLLSRSSLSEVVAMALHWSWSSTATLRESERERGREVSGSDKNPNSLKWKFTQEHAAV